MQINKLTDYIFRQEVKNSHLPAIHLADKTFFTYGQLAAKITEFSLHLQKSGFNKNDRIAVVMPNCTEAVIAFLAITDRAVAVPLDPENSLLELKKYFALTKVTAVIVTEENFLKVQQAAVDMEITLMVMRADVYRSYKLITEHDAAADRVKWRKTEEDSAVVLLTSGTSSGHKVVVLTHANLINEANTKVPGFDLQENDRLIIYPALFHIYGIAIFLAVMAAGGSILCLPHFEVKEFFRAIREFKITQYVGTPAIHQVIAEYTEKISSGNSNFFLRIIQSGGALLSPTTAKILENYFGAIVVQGYGLTETTALATLMPLLQEKIKIDSVGRPAGCEIRIMDEKKNWLLPKNVGQIVIRGKSVIAGYENVADDKTIFLEDGWFVTGDVGYFDEDGYLFLVGRSSEVINRGGVKISPYEVERVLCNHEDIKEAIIFGAAHPSLGEIPMALVVLKKSSKLTEASVKEFLKNEILLYKVPVRIFFAAHIPKNNNGKVVRRSLYQYIKDHKEDFADMDVKEGKERQPNAIEIGLLNIWRTLLGNDKIEINDNYFEVGGDSLGLVTMFTEIERVFQVSLPEQIILINGTVQDLALAIENETRCWENFDFIVPVSSVLKKQHNLFVVHALTGEVLTYRKLAEYMGKDYAVYGLSFNMHAQKLQVPVSIVELARLYIEEIRIIQPQGPYFLAGYSVGGMIAYEISRQLKLMNEIVALVALIDARVKFNASSIKMTFDNLRHNALAGIKRFREGLESTDDSCGVEKIKKMEESLTPFDDIFISAKVLQNAFNEYCPKPYHGILTYFNACLGNKLNAEESLNIWKTLADEIQIENIAAMHATIMEDDSAVKTIADKLKSEIAQIIKNPQ